MFSIRRVSSSSCLDDAMRATDESNRERKIFISPHHHRPRRCRINIKRAFVCFVIFIAVYLEIVWDSVHVQLSVELLKCLRSLSSLSSM